MGRLSSQVPQTLRYVWFTLRLYSSTYMPVVQMSVVKTMAVVIVDVADPVLY